MKQFCKFASNSLKLNFEEICPAQKVFKNKKCDFHFSWRMNLCWRFLAGWWPSTLSDRWVQHLWQWNTNTNTKTHLGQWNTKTFIRWSSPLFLGGFQPGLARSDRWRYLILSPEWYRLELSPYGIKTFQIPKKVMVASCLIYIAGSLTYSCISLAPPTYNGRPRSIVSLVDCPTQATDKYKRHSRVRDAKSWRYWRYISVIFF